MNANGHVKLEKGIPIPHRCFRMCKYPLHTMKPGESFTVEFRNARSVRIAISMYKARVNKKAEFVTRRMDVDTVRIWRTK